MGSGASSTSKQKESTVTKDNREFDPIKSLYTQTDRLETASKDLAQLDAFIDASYTHGGQDGGENTQPNHALATDSVQATMKYINNYIQNIDERVEKLRHALNDFKDAVVERCHQYSGDEELRKLSSVRQQINIVDDVIRRTEEGLEKVRKDNTATSEIKDLQRQVQSLNLFKTDIQNNRDLSARFAETQLSESDFVVGDILRWRDHALAMKQKYDTTLEEYNKLQADREKDLKTYQINNDKFVAEIKDLKEEINNADATVEECEVKVQAVQETLLDERLSHEVEISALKAIIEQLTATGGALTPAPAKGDVRLSPEGFGGIDAELTPKTGEKDTKIITPSSPLQNVNEMNDYKSQENNDSNSPQQSTHFVKESKMKHNEIDNKTMIENNGSNNNAINNSVDKSSTKGSNSEINEEHSENEESGLNQPDGNKSELDSANNSSRKPKERIDAKQNNTIHNEEPVANEVVLFEEGVMKEIVYRRNDGDIDGNLSYHKGVGAVIKTNSSSFGVDSISCEIIDELEINMLPDFVEGERVVSFQLHFQKKYGVDVQLQDDKYFAVYVPHRHIQAFEEASVIQSVDGGDWEPCDLLDDRPTALNEEVLVVGTKLRSLDDIKLIAIAREKLETIVVEADNEELMHQSRYDCSVTLKLRASTFDKRTEVKFLVHDSHRRNMPAAVELHDECKQIVSCTSFVSITTEVITKQDVNIVMELKEDMESECKYTMFSLDDGGWKLADCDWNNNDKTLIVHLRSGFKKYRILGLELPADLSVEDRLLAVNTLHQHVGHHLVRLLFRQREDDPTQAVVICLSSRLVKTGIYELKELGYSVGGYPSSQFCLREGDTLRIQYSGGIVASPVNSEKMEMTFYPQKGIATKQLALRYHDDVINNKPRDKQGCMQVYKADDNERCILGETLCIELENKTDS